MRTLGLLLLSCCAAIGQPGDAALSFEVASVKAAPPLEPGKPMFAGCRGGSGSKTDPGRWTCQNMTVSTLIFQAYNLKRYQMPDQSGLFDAARFDITAKVPDGATVEQFRQMQQNLLKDRFKLAVHFEKKEMSGYELVVAKGGPKLKEADPAKGDATDSFPPPPPPGPPAHDKDGYPILPRGARGTIVENGKARWAAPDATAEQIANMLANELNRPVIDATGLQGKYEISIVFVMENMMRRPALAGPGPDGGAPVAADPETGPTLTSALQDQLGLKLQPKKVTVDMLVIDHVEKAPTEN